ncbi:MAG: Hpt domain-containing protein [Desulfobacterales bacterium]|nr:Hpt domain-containing protein [Desulfobacterales bacterium]
MNKNSKKGFIITNTFTFAENIIRVIEDMAGLSFKLFSESFKEKPFSTSKTIISFITFSGGIQGDYVIALNESTAAKLIRACDNTVPNSSKLEIKEDCYEFLKELLNIAVGLSIVPLELSFGNLTYSPSILVSGQINFPQVMSGIVDIKYDDDVIECALLLNLANLRIGHKLEEALKDLEKKSIEANESRKNIESILKLLPSGLVAINSLHKVLPGYSKATSYVVGYEKDTKIEGLNLCDVLGITPNIAYELTRWLEILFLNYGKMPFEELISANDIGEIKNERGKILRLGFLPVENDKDYSLEKLLVIIDDITYKRKLESDMERLSNTHDENLEMMTQVLRLEPEEVNNFIADSYGLLATAQNLLINENKSNEVVHELYRAFHTLKGNSGQFNFKGLMQLFHKIEDYLKPLRENIAFITDVKLVNTIINSINDAKDYIARLKNIYQKIVEKKQGLKEIAKSAFPSVKVNLFDIDDIIKSLNGVIAKIESAPEFPKFLDGIRNVFDKVIKLRQIKLSSFISSLEVLLDNTCKKLNKNAQIKIENDVDIDVEIMQKLYQCFIHLVNNAIDHGIEPAEERIISGKNGKGLILLSGKKNCDKLEITIEDDGQGIEPEILRSSIKKRYKLKDDEIQGFTNEELYLFLLKPGFSTKKTVNEISGRGVGLDFVAYTINKLGGKIFINSIYGEGTKIIMQIPDISNNFNTNPYITAIRN